LPSYWYGPDLQNSTDPAGGKGSLSRFQEPKCTFQPQPTAPSPAVAYLRGREGTGQCHSLAWREIWWTKFDCAPDPL